MRVPESEVCDRGPDATHKELKRGCYQLDQTRELVRGCGKILECGFVATRSNHASPEPPLNQLGGSIPVDGNTAVSGRHAMRSGREHRRSQLLIATRTPSIRLSSFRCQRPMEFNGWISGPTFRLAWNWDKLLKRLVAISFVRWSG